MATLKTNSSQPQNTQEYIEKEWKSEMALRNSTLNDYRSYRYAVGGINSALTGKAEYVDDNSIYWSYDIFDGYGHIIHPEEYFVLSKLYGEKYIVDNIRSAKFYYDNNLGSQYGIYYASNLIFDGNNENDEEGLKILENESWFHRSKLEEDEESPSSYKPSSNADFILGKYYSLKDRETALDYYDSAMGGSFTDRDIAKQCFSSSCLDLLKNDEYDADFLQKLTDVIHKREATGEFTRNLDKRLTVKDHELSINAETWVDTQSSLITSSEKNVKDTYIHISSVWKRVEDHLDKGVLTTKDAINLLQKSTIYDENGKSQGGYTLTASSQCIADLYIDNRIGIKETNEAFSQISSSIKNPPKLITSSYEALINKISENKSEQKKSFTDEEKREITDYVGGGYGGKITDGDTLTSNILSLDKKGAIDRGRLKSIISVENYNLYREKIISDYKNQSSYDVADSLLQLEIEGNDKNRSFVDEFLKQKGPSKDDNTANLFHFITTALKDDKTTSEQRSSLLREYTEYLNRKEIKLSEEQQKELDEIATDTFKDYIKEEAAAKNEDVLKTIDRLVSEGKIPADEAKNIKNEMLKSGEIPVTDTEMEPVEFEVNGEKIKMDFTATGWYDKILNFSFKNNKSDAKEIVDVVSEYGWMNNTTNKNTSSDFIKHNNIPYCYAVEYRQLYNASISNIILSFLGLAYSAKGAASGVYNLAGSAIDGIINLSSPLVKLISGAFSDDNSNSNKSTTLPPQDGGQTTGEKNTSEGKESWLDKAGRTINSWANKGDEYFRGAMEKVAYLDSRGPIATGRKSGLLNPYRMMYILSKTDKQYCFPMLDKSASSYKVSNKMDEADGGQGSRLLGNRFFGMVANLAQTVLGIAQDINQIAPFFQSAIGNADNIKSMRQYHIERSKFFSFPTDGEDIEVSFILFNTVKKNIWKKHFNFIFGFVLRNLPFKHDLVSYYPPLFYDVIVPGVKRCPYCYVERIDVSPLGLMRNMSVSSEDIGLPNLTNGGGKMNYTVNVPEAWQVKIVFKSLIATSGNQILSGFVDMPIQASSSNDSLKNKNENKK